jgi:hypothetical protein
LRVEHSDHPGGVERSAPELLLTLVRVIVLDDPTTLVGNHAPRFELDRSGTIQSIFMRLEETQWRLRTRS